VSRVADVLGHSDPSITLKVYADAMRQDEEDVSFLPSLATTAPRRHQNATKTKSLCRT
jgi:hypothetical protein